MKSHRRIIETVDRRAQFPNTLCIQWVPFFGSTQRDFITTLIRLRRGILNVTTPHVQFFGGSEEDDLKVTRMKANTPRGAHSAHFYH